MSIEAKNIRKEFGSFAALNDVSLKIETGELMALLGPSGSGKTTLLRIIAGLEAAEAGQIFFFDEDATRLSIRDRRVGFVFQHYALFRHMTIFNNIAFGLQVRPRRGRPSREEIAEKVRELLRLVQLDGLENRYPAQISGGQRQRVALARALAVEPRVLLLDEPFGALDAKVRKELRRWIRRLHDELRITTVFVTHDQEEAFEIADRVVVMNNARIEQIGTPQEIYDHPASAFVCEFLDDVNALEPSRSKANAASDRPAHEPGETRLFIRPRDIEVLRQQNGSPTLETVVEAIHTAGAVAKLRLRLCESREILEVELPRERHEELSLRAGERAFVKFRRTRTFPAESTNA